PEGVGRRWLIAAVFGLVHGLGFASALTELDLSRAAMVRALVGFNLGVELGQLAFVVVVLPPLAWASPRPPAAPAADPVGAGGDCGCGLAGDASSDLKFLSIRRAEIQCAERSGAVGPRSKSNSHYSGLISFRTNSPK